MITAPHRKPRITPLLAIIAIFPIIGCATTKRNDEPTPPRLAEWADLNAVENDLILLGAQPSDAALDEFAARGGLLVINLRTDKEMEFLPYYDRSLASRGLVYIRIPTSGDTFGPETGAALDDALTGSKGRPVLIHCASGGRATYAWAMHRIAGEGLSADDAIAWAVQQRDGKEWEAGAEVLREFDAGRPERPSDPERGQN